MDFLRRVFFWICLGLALFSAAILSMGSPSFDWALLVVIGTVSGLYLLFALASRFLFTGRWSRD